MLKCGSPAAQVNPGKFGSDFGGASRRFGDTGGSGDDATRAPCWIDPSARHLTNVEPFRMKGDIKSLQFDISLNKYVCIYVLKVLETATQKIEPKFICHVM